MSSSVGDVEDYMMGDLTDSPGDAESDDDSEDQKIRWSMLDTRLKFLKEHRTKIDKKKAKPKQAAR